MLNPEHGENPQTVQAYKAILQVDSRVEELMDLARRVLEPELSTPSVSFDLTGKAAGMASRDGYRIRLNLGLFLENSEDYLKNTIPHEVAHCVVSQICGPREQPHGYSWQRTMLLFGAVPERCHHYDTTNHVTRRQRRYSYRCGCREHQLSATRHNRIQRGIQKYRCRRCGGELRR